VVSDVSDGDRIVTVAAAGTAGFAMSATSGVVWPDVFGLASAIVSGALFLVGCGAFATGFLAGVSRSRAEEVDLAGLFFLTGTAPAPIRRRLRGFTLLQVVIAFTAAGIRPFTESAFGVLVPVFGLGLMALWGGRHGDFAAKGAEKPAGD
jgi:hypothetical protein